MGLCLRGKGQGRLRCSLFLERARVQGGRLPVMCDFLQDLGFQIRQRLQGFGLEAVLEACMGP